MALLASLASPFAGRGVAQEKPPPPPEEFPQAPAAPSEPPGRFRLGPVYLTPIFRIGSIGLDTNVFYTATDRRTDLAANGGPGFEAVLPLARGTRIFLGAGFNYVYFVRTPSQRKLGGDARAGVEWGAHRVKARVEEEYSRSFSRPSLEVDRRVLQDRWNCRAYRRKSSSDLVFGILRIDVLRRTRFASGRDFDCSGCVTL